LKLVAGATAISALPAVALSENEKDKVFETLQAEPWLTLNAVLDHLLPKSSSGPSAKELQVVIYSYNVMYQQSTEKSEIDFILKGVGWLNRYIQNQLQKTFIELSKVAKETML
jgi:gluconate 2-dehydrogenase gamma chain